MWTTLRFSLALFDPHLTANGPKGFRYRFAVACSGMQRVFEASLSGLESGTGDWLTYKHTTWSDYLCRTLAIKIARQGLSQNSCVAREYTLPAELNHMIALHRLDFLLSTLQDSADTNSESLLESLLGFRFGFLTGRVYKLCKYWSYRLSHRDTEQATTTSQPCTKQSAFDYAVAYRTTQNCTLLCLKRQALISTCFMTAPIGANSVRKTMIEIHRQVRLLWDPRASCPSPRWAPRLSRLCWCSSAVRPQQRLQRFQRCAASVAAPWRWVRGERDVEESLVFGGLRVD